MLLARFRLSGGQPAAPVLVPVTECPPEQDWGWGVWPSLALARAGRTWLCFRCALAMWSRMHGKAHCSLVKGFTGGSEPVPRVRDRW